MSASYHILEQKNIVKEIKKPDAEQLTHTYIHNNTKKTKITEAVENVQILLDSSY